MPKSIYFILLALLTSFQYNLAWASSSEQVDLNPALQAQLKSLPLPEDISGKPPRFAYLRKLLEISSGARQVLGSDSPEAHSAYVKARETYILAALEPETSKVNTLLDQTVKLMYEAIRAASPKKMLNHKKERDYKRKLLSVNALLEALDRIAIEKKNVDDTNKLKFNISEILASAEQLVKKSDFDKAREQLDEAYLLTKTGIDNMRSGDVLVRELKFASKEEEFSYEQDRNDTHQMLIEILVEKKLGDKPESYRKTIYDKIVAARNIRKQAEKMSTAGNFDDAIIEIEKSTKELVRAIRMGGIFIPG
ncbi:MAG: hypothetical protein ISR73_13010 [Gammaproteobacteria bacterium]|nr:hypothetical protein [Gammaproteobacteria bacterium]